jgi:RND family efflux transporter MFP subunit
MTNWKKVKLVLEVVEVRLRFIAILVATALVIGYWDTIKNYWDKWTRPPSAAAAQTDSDHEYYCPMHPQVVRAGLEPNGEVPKCPICGMPLSLRKKGEMPPLPPGVTGRVQLSPERIQLAGVETTEVAYRPLSRQTITVGNVTYDESRLSRIVSRVNGYVEKLYVDKTFATVNRGDPLAELYSPELYATAQELLLASKRAGGADMAASARERLRLLGVSDEDLSAMVAAGKANPRLVIRAPRTGDVIGKPIVAGARVEEGMTLLEVADLSVVWIEADVYEKDVPLVRAGEKIEATVEALPNRVFDCRVAMVYPQVDTATRTNRVRFEVQNAAGELHPGMFATVRIDTPASSVERPAGEMPKRGEVLVVPERAVIDTGTKQIVYVEREPGLFEGVEVELGPRTGGFYPVVKGLEPGERVVAAGAFLIDAETRLNPAAASTYFGASGGPQAAANAGAATVTQPAAAPDAAKPSSVPLSEAAKKNIAKLPPEDQAAALAQKYCPITGALLGSMGVPVKIILKRQTVFLCCPGCVDEAKKDPEATLKKVDKLKHD